MHIFLKFKDYRLQNIYEEEQLKQFCVHLKLYRPFTALVIVIQFVFILFDYLWGLGLPNCSKHLTAFIVRIVLIVLESITLYMYFDQSAKQRKKLSALLELIFTLIFTSSYILNGQIILGCLSDGDLSKEMIVAFALKVGTEFLWRYLFIAFVCKLWISQIINIFFSLGWVLIWIIKMDQALLIVQALFNIFVWLFIICFSEKIKRVSFLTSKDFHDKELIYKNIFDIVPEYIFVLDNQGKIRHVNKFAQESLGGDLRCLEKLRDLRWRRNVSMRKSDLSDTSPMSDKRAKPLIHIRGSLEATSNALESVGTFVDIHKLFKQNLFEVVGENAAVYDCKYADESSYQKRSFELKVSSIRNQLERFLLVTLKDTTERDMIVALESENVVYRNNLLASFSHELRTPLNGTISFMEQLMDAEELSDQAKDKYVQPALSSAKLLVFLIQDILDYSQLLLNKFDVSFKLGRISETVWDCFSLFEHKFKEKNLQYEINVSPAVPNYTYTDHKRISQILINILTNAVRFTMSGNIMISVEAIENQALRITIADTGIGMDENTQTRLRYHLNSGMLKGKISSSSAGIGMGLTIAHRIAQKLGPNEDEGLEFESTFGKGSQFSFKIQNRIEDASLDDIDLALSDVVEFDGKRKLSKGISHLHLARSPIPSHRESVFGFEPMALEKPRVLIVDDDAFNIVALETICHMLKLKTERAFHGKEALEKLIASNRRSPKGRQEGEGPYKIVFMDCNMPVMDGFEATRAIKEMIWKGEIEEVKVIGVTAYVGENDVKKCFSSGMDEVLNKPVFKKTLVETLKKYCVID